VGVYGLADGDQVLFSQYREGSPAAQAPPGEEPSAVVQAPEPAGCKRGRGRPRASPKPKSKAKASKGTSSIPKEPSTAAKARPAEGTPSIPNDAAMRSTAVKAGPAKGWHVTAWLQDSANDKSMCCWRALSPGRSRSFQVAGSRRACPELETESSPEIYAQIFRDVRPKLFQRLNGCRRAQETARVIPTPTRARAQEEERPSEPKRRKTMTYGAKPVAQKAVPGIGRCDLATQLFVGPSSEGAPVEDLGWKCNCSAHLKRHPRCVVSDKLVPSLVHLRDYMLIGRGETCDVVLDSQRSPMMISRCHAVLNQEDGGFAIIDQGSMNGLLVNDTKVSGRQTLAHGDVITFGVPQAAPEFDYIFETRPAPPEGEDVW